MNHSISSSSSVLGKRGHESDSAEQLPFQTVAPNHIKRSNCTNTVFVYSGNKRNTSQLEAEGEDTLPRPLGKRTCDTDIDFLANEFARAVSLDGKSPNEAFINTAIENLQVGCVDGAEIYRKKCSIPFRLEDIRAKAVLACFLYHKGWIEKASTLAGEVNGSENNLRVKQAMHAGFADIHEALAQKE